MDTRIQAYNFNRADYFFSAQKQEEKPAPKSDSLENVKARMTQIRMEILFNTKNTLSEQAETFKQLSGSPLDDGSKYTLEYIAGLSQSEARELISEDGYWGIAKTAGRIADFVLKGAHDDLGRLQAGREGILRGFKEAEELWGGTLPEISYNTIQQAVEQIDQRIHELGGSIIDLAA